MSIVDHYKALDAALVAHGFPETSPWWLATIERFYTSGRRQLVLRCGRRAGKSTSLCRIGVVEALAGEHAIPPGDLGIVAIISVSRDEAAKRLRTIEAILRALDVAHKPLRDGTGIELIDRPVAFQVFTASLAGVVGGTVICAICDEVSRWRDTDTGSNPATEVLGSLRPTLATQKNARLFLSSSPLSTVDAHAKAFDEGETSFQCVAHGETWACNPTLSEADCRALEPDQKTFAREYAAIPSATEGGALDALALKACVRTIEGQAAGSPVGFFDSSGGKNDACAWLLAQWTRARDGQRLLRIFGAGALDGRRLAETWTVDAVGAHVAGHLRQHGATRIVGDQFGAWAWSGAFSKRGIFYRERAWSNEAKTTAVIRLRQLIREGALAIEPGPEADALIAEARNFKEKYLDSGAIQFAASRGHDDRIMTLLLVARADAEGELGGSPMSRASEARAYPVRAIPTQLTGSLLASDYAEVPLGFKW